MTSIFTRIEPSGSLHLEIYSRSTTGIVQNRRYHWTERKCCKWEFNSGYDRQSYKRVFNND